MTFIKSVLAAAFLLGAFGLQSPAAAKSRIYLDVGYHGPRVGVYVGRPYGWGRRYYRPYYRPYVRGYYRPYYKPYPRYYGPRPLPNGCGYWSARCVENWGYGNNDYYGCLRYHGCN